MLKKERAVNIHKGFSNSTMRQVTCPDCGISGGSEYPCYYHRCETDVMMLPSCNGRIRSNWAESRTDV
jgi:hypothetical protein